MEIRRPSDTHPIDRDELEREMARLRDGAPEPEAASSREEDDLMTLKAFEAVEGLVVGDTSATVTEEMAEAFWQKGVRVIGRCFDRPGTCTLPAA